MSEFVSISDASKTLNRSRTWVRSKAAELEKSGKAKMTGGKWEVNINALSAVRGATKNEQETHMKKTTDTEWIKIVENLRADNSDLRSENKQLRAELTALLSSKKGIMRWLRI